MVNEECSPVRPRRHEDGGSRLDEPALTSLIRNHTAPLLRYVTRLTFNDRQLAEDIVQETFLRVWKRPDVVNDRYASLGPWLFTVARNLVNDHKRVRAARPVEINDSELASYPAERDLIDETLVAQAVRQAMARLTPEHRTVLLQIYHRGLTFADVAQELGIPVGTVKSRTHYALRSLRAVLESQRADHLRW
jgi:RNA polymerase sigma-70 factor (ECF subfamily)